MQIGVEVRKLDVIIVKVEGNCSNLIGQSTIKLALDNDSIKECIDFKKSFSMYIDENKVTKISLVVGGNDSSKIRIIIEYLIQEIAFKHSIEIKTYASTALKRLKEKFKKEHDLDFKTFYTQFGLPVYSENAYIVAWRYS